jgi:(R)-2-hydroxyacyl-CoA dehydratese activating ATPase
MEAQPSVYTAGIDIGSITCKAVILKEGQDIVASLMIPTGVAQGVADRILDKALSIAKLTREDISYVVSTGYGRMNVPFSNKQVTEITCHGRGVHHVMPDARIIVDIGGQDSKVIRVDENGRLVDFAMNDKCAAGSGRFLEVMARALEIKLEDMGPMSLDAPFAAETSSTCTVFAESEVISQLSRGVPIKALVAGIHSGIVDRVYALMRSKIRGAEDETITMSGGVANNVGVVSQLSQKVGRAIKIPPEPQLMGALGAAVVAHELHAKKEQKTG